jgi:ribonuclease HI
MRLTYYTDGGCEPNPGKGTWAFVCLEPRIEQSGHDAEATSNKMEMTAIIRAIENALEQRADAVDIYSDSQYCVKGFNEWMSGWSRKGWMRADRDGELSPVKNRELWQKLYGYKVRYGQTMPIRLTWVKGHNGNEFNELCDELVRQEYGRVFGGQMQY